LIKLRAIENCKKLIKISERNLMRLSNDYSQDESCEAFINSTEKLALCARLLACYCPTQKECDKAEKSIGSTMNIQVGETKEGFFKVSLPMLRHREYASTAAFIQKPLRIALANYFDQYPNRKKRYIDNGVVATVFCYSTSKDKKSCYDIDNINEREYKSIIDDISLFTLPDDGPFSCARYLTAKQSDNERTEIYVISQKDFPKWYKEYADFDNKIQQNNN
jgi:hypothetical protein